MKSLSGGRSKKLNGSEKPMKFRTILTAAAIFGSGFWGSAASALDMVPTLSLDIARKMADGCVAKAQEMGWKMNISVVDSGANAILFNRMNGAFLGSSEIARHKAETSAKFPFPTRFVEELGYGKDHKGGALPGFALVPGLVAFAGGLPIMAGSVHLGGIGVSGGTADQDETCAQAGLDAAKNLLK
jgi:glc operon protein GlcG